MGATKCGPVSVKFSDIYGMSEYEAIQGNKIPPGFELTGQLFFPGKRSGIFLDTDFTVTSTAAGLFVPGALVAELRPVEKPAPASCVYELHLAAGELAIIFRPTGEFRAPRFGEWYCYSDEDGGAIYKAGPGMAITPRQILERFEFTAAQPAGGCYTP